MSQSSDYNRIYCNMIEILVKKSIMKFINIIMIKIGNKWL